MGMVKIIDYFLPKDEFEIINKFIFSDDFPWFFVGTINEEYEKKDLESYFVHHIFDRNVGYSKYANPFRKLLVSLNAKSFIRVKANMYLRTHNLDVHKAHIDYPYKHKAAIFYVNTNNGKTILHDKYGTEVDSVANRLLIFDAHKKHSSTSTTDTKCRVNINLNYF